MTRYVAHCDVCGDVGKSTTIKQRAERKREVHVCETGHLVHVNKVTVGAC